MVFSSLEFLFLYLPVVLAIYFLIPARRLAWRNAALLAVSLIFYGWGEPLYVFLMIATIIADWIFGFLIERSQKAGKSAKGWLITAVAVNIGILFFFKYSGFIAENLRRIPLLRNLRVPQLSLPIGISFYTFQALSYVIDVYRRDSAAQHSLTAFGTYITFFPQLIAGPIVRYQEVADQLLDRQTSISRFAAGLRTFCAGLGKKVLLANTAGALWEHCQSLPTDERTVFAAWMGIIFYTFQIYFDFSGYSDMAIGLGRLFGFSFPENFNYPYTAVSITDFWRRWHITLTTWFREYIYIPLGGNRRGVARTILNTFVVWLLTGLWHGASWNFILWGLYYFVLSAIERLGLLRVLDRLPTALRRIYTLFFVAIGWLLFASDQNSGGLSYFGTLFGVGGAGLFGGNNLYDLLRLLPFTILLVFACTPLPKRFYLRMLSRHEALTAWLSCLGSLLLLMLGTAYLVDSSYNPFLYFRF